MNCCGNHNHGENHEGHNHQGTKHNSHKWMMMLCCVLPIVIVAGKFLTNVITGTASGNTWVLLLLLLCPLSHMILMPLMMKKK
jgi:hypothetical protein